jgi:hypothetical protein
LRYHITAKSIFKIRENSSYLCKCIIKYEYFILLKSEWNVGKKIADYLLNMNACSKRKCILSLDTSSWKHYIMSFLRCDALYDWNLLCFLTSCNQYSSQHKLWVTPHVLLLVFGILALVEVNMLILFILEGFYTKEVFSKMFGWWLNTKWYMKILYNNKIVL